MKIKLSIYLSIRLSSFFSCSHGVVTNYDLVRTCQQNMNGHSSFIVVFKQDDSENGRSTAPTCQSVLKTDQSAATVEC